MRSSRKKRRSDKLQQMTVPVFGHLFKTVGRVERAALEAVGQHAHPAVVSEADDAAAEVLADDVAGVSSTYARFLGFLPGPRPACCYRPGWVSALLSDMA